MTATEDIRTCIGFNNSKIRAVNETTILMNVLNKNLSNTSASNMITNNSNKIYPKLYFNKNFKLKSIPQKLIKSNSTTNINSLSSNKTLSIISFPSKIKQKNLAEFNKFVSIKQDEMENLKLKVKHKKKIKSCDSRKISPNKKLQKKFSKITTCNTLDKELNNNNSTFNVIFKNLNNEKGERNYYLKNMILHNKQNDQNINIINNIQMDKSNINNSRKINLNNLSGKIYLESYNKVMTKKSS